MPVRPAIEKLAALYSQPERMARDGNDDLVQVSVATKRLAFAYERFRNTLEPDEEDILRRGSVYRILERRLQEDRSDESNATALLQELIRGSYIEAIPVSFVPIIANLIKQAKVVMVSLPEEEYEWFLHIVAVAIDRELYPRHREEVLAHTMYQDTFARTSWADNLIEAKDRPTQLYIACHRALFGVEDSEIIYHYFNHQFPKWRSAAENPEVLQEILTKLPKFKIQIEEHLKHSVAARLVRLIKPVSVPYRIMRDMLSTDPTILSKGQDEVINAGHKAVTERARHIRDSMTKRAWHSILFLLITKIALTFLIEVPYERFIYGEAHLGALVANTVFHPVLLFFMAISARLPGAANTEKVAEQVYSITHGEPPLPTIPISTPRQYGAATWSAFAVLYVFLFIGIFWALFTFLDSLGFSVVAMFLFIVFLGLVSFLATRIRRSVDDVQLLPRKERAMSMFVTFLFLPILEFGRWMSQNVQRLNVLLFFMDHILEAPFKLLIDITEEWFGFIRDRKEEIV